MPYVPTWRSDFALLIFCTFVTSSIDSILDTPIVGLGIRFFSLSCIFALFFTHFIIYIDCNLLVHIHFSGFATASASSSHSGLLDTYHWARNSLYFRCRVSFYCFIHITILSWSASTYITLIFDVSQQRFPPIACMVILPSNDGRYIISVVW